MRYTHYSPYYLPQFTILQHYSPLFTTIDHYSPLVFPRFSGSSPSADTGAAGSGEPTGESSEAIYSCGGFHSHGGSPFFGWSLRETPMKIDDLGADPFQETSIYIVLYTWI